MSETAGLVVGRRDRVNDVDRTYRQLIEIARNHDLQENLWSLLSVDVVDLDDGVSQAHAEDIRRDGKVLYEKI